MAMTHDYNDLEFTTAHEDCPECERMLVMAYEALRQAAGWSEISTGDAVHFGKVSVVTQTA